VDRAYAQFITRIHVGQMRQPLSIIMPIIRLSSSCTFCRRHLLTKSKVVSRQRLCCRSLRRCYDHPRWWDSGPTESHLIEFTPATPQISRRRLCDRPNWNLSRAVFPEHRRKRNDEWRENACDTYACDAEFCRLS